MNSDATNLDLALSAYSAVAGFIGHAVLGAIMAVEVGFDEIADAKGRAVYLPWEMGLVD